MPGVLKDQERERLRTEVASYVNGNPSVLKTIIPDYHLWRISTDSMPLRYAYNVVRYCEMYAWIETPSLIISLMNRWKDLPIFHEAIQRLQNEQPPRFFVGSRPWDAILLAVDLPFLDRKQTRQAIEYFTYPLIPDLHPAGIRVLIVNGPQKSGKTYTYDYIRYINICLADLSFKVVFLDIRKQFTGDFGPLEFTQVLLDRINPDWRSQQVQIPALDNQQPARWIQQLCGVIAEQSAYTNIVQVIVLDGLGENPDPVTGETAPVPREIVEMVMLLSSIATGSQMAQFNNDMLRLVLLGFNQPVPNYMNRMRVDLIQPLTRTDLAEYFQNFAIFHNKQLDPAAVQPMIDAVLKDDLSTDINRTEKLSRRALEIAKRIII